MSDQTLPITLSHLEDEALYSYLGRANLSNCMGASKPFVALAFGRLKAVISADLPSELSVLLETAPQLSPYPSLEQIIELSTQYPYYRPFMSEAKWNELVTRATRGTGVSLKTWLGLPAHRFTATTMFRSCVMCDRTAWDTEGTFYTAPAGTRPARPGAHTRRPAARSRRTGPPRRRRPSARRRSRGFWPTRSPQATRRRSGR